ncbi:DNA polymerase beta superfamily protein [Bacillus sp. SCS-153A]|uniref:nucleotidyltransferase domain-containing protein n=1 Tax=Rossellomorea sedimentorum TaxID=3115294 RepID=UPI0039064F97
MDALILRELSSLEREHDIRILFAVQAGSRAWGFHSPKSDWDIRFIYKHPLDWYLSLNKNSDVIEKQVNDDLELSGWDLRKALNLLKKSNPTMLEWLHTEERMIVNQHFWRSVQPLIAELFSPISCYFHYLSMSKANWKKWQKDNVKSPKLTLHLLRGMLCCLWIKEYESFPPVKFQHLYEKTVKDRRVCEDVANVVALKKEGADTFDSTAPALYFFIEKEMENLLTANPTFPEKKKIPHEVINTVFRDLIKGDR